MKKLFALVLMTTFLKTGVCQSVNEEGFQIANVERRHILTTDSVFVVSDVHFQQKKTDRWLLGNHYRREWSAVVKVPIVIIDTFHGGATAIKESGGKQTKTLRLELDNNNDRQYVLRSVEKYSDKVLPEQFAGTLATKLVKDQSSSSHPFAPVVVAAMAKAAGILHTNPRFVFVPHSKRLQQFDSLYGNRFYLLEERPKGNWQESASLGYADNIINTEKLQAQLQASAGNSVDQKAYLRARLLDVLVGDWDRHEDQWAWANLRQSNNRTVYQPIPRDRDQAFANLDGVLPWLGRRKWAFRRGQHFTHKIGDVTGLVWSARNLDRQLLTNLEWTDWEREVRESQAAWTDDVIEKAVQQLPDALYQISGLEITDKLISRRNALTATAHRFYRTLAKEVEWIGTNGDDHFSIEAVNDTAFAISQFAMDGANLICIRKRVFQRKETKVVTLYGLGGNDNFIYEGNQVASLKIRLIGGEGNKRYQGPGLLQAPKVKVYDKAIAARSDVRPFGLKKRYDSLTHEYQYHNHEYSIVRPLLLPAFNPDDGLFVGAGIGYQRAQWGHRPFGQYHLIQASYAFRTRAYHFIYEGIFKKVLGKWDVYFNGEVHQPGQGRNFYGFGNNTKLTTRNRDFNRVRVDQVLLMGGLQQTFRDQHTVRFLGHFLSTQVEENNKRFVSKSNLLLDSSAFLKTKWAGGTFVYGLNTLNQLHYPSSGLRWATQVSYFHANRNSRNITNLTSSISVFIPLKSVVLAARVGGATFWGDPLFFQYNQLGGLENLRGFRRSRFSGKTSFYTNSEVRVPLSYVKTVLVNGQCGLLLFCDNGRVWIPNERSDQWHWGYGGGLWLTPFDRVAVVAQLGFSKEDRILTLKTGFQF